MMAQGTSYIHIYHMPPEFGCMLVFYVVGSEQSRCKRKTGGAKRSSEGTREGHRAEHYRHQLSFAIISASAVPVACLAASDSVCLGRELSAPPN